MDIDQEDTRQRLRKLGASRLVDALCTLAARNEEAADYVARLVSTPEESSCRIRSRLDELAYGTCFIGYDEAYGFARNLEGLIEDVRMNITDPEEGLEVVSSFFEMDKPILERCDDSNGAVAEVFHWYAGEAFVQFGKGCKDKAFLLERVFTLYMGSKYGVRSVLIERAAEFLPKKLLRELAQKLWAHVEDVGEEGHGSGHALRGVEALAHQLADPALFEKARMYGRPEATASCCLDIAKAYAECHEDADALAWLERMPEDNHWRHSEQDGLLLRLLKRKGERKKAEEVSWRIFRRHRSEASFEQLVELAGEKMRGSILSGQIAEILDSERFSTTDAAFLVEMNLKDAAAKYLVGHASRLEGREYSCLTPLAQAMEEAKQFLAASVAYRALLDSILARGQSKAYHYGARYLRKLDAMAAKLSSWDSLTSHEEYKAAIVKDHRRKRRFWEEYGERPE